MCDTLYLDSEVINFFYFANMDIFKWFALNDNVMGGFSGVSFMICFYTNYDSPILSSSMPNQLFERFFQKNFYHVIQYPKNSPQKISSQKYFFFHLGSICPFLLFNKISGNFGDAVHDFNKKVKTEM